MLEFEIPAERFNACVHQSVELAYAIVLYMNELVPLTGDLAETIPSVASLRRVDCFPRNRGGFHLRITGGFRRNTHNALNKENNPWLFQSARNAIPQCLQ